MFVLKKPPSGGDHDPIGRDDSGNVAQQDNSVAFLEPKLYEVSSTDSGKLKESCSEPITDQQIKTLAVFNDFIKYNFSITTPGMKISELSSKEAHSELQKAKTITLGDIHGSYEKLVETLITSGLATMPTEDAARFVALSAKFEDFVAKNPFLEDAPDSWQSTVEEGSITLSRAKLMHAELSDILAKVRWTGGSDRQLILLGDVLADRGVTDTLTLQLLNQLSEGAPDRFVRLTSNHDHCAISYLVTGETHKLMQSNTRLSYAESQIRAFKLSDNKDELVQLYKAHIKELKLIHYDRDSKTLYSHAPITPENFKSLIGALKEYNYLGQDFEYEHINDETIGDFVKLANEFYQDLVSRRFEYGLKGMDPELEKLINTDPKGFVWPRTKYQAKSELPLLNGAVETIVHGHALNSRRSSPLSIDYVHERDSADLEELKYLEFAVVCLDNGIRKVPGESCAGAESPLFAI